VGVLAFALPTALVRFTSLSVIWTDALECTLKLSLCGLAIVVVAVDAWRVRRDSARPVGFALAAVASIATAAYFNFGFFHGDGFVHQWEQFHYHLGAKYFPELGYDGLYVASIGAESDAFPNGVVAEHSRDLRTYQVAPVAELFPHMREVWQRFEPARWDALIEDNRFFVETIPQNYLWAQRLDHGYNATPAWTFVARVLAGSRPVSLGFQRALALLDVALLAGAFAAVFLTFGARVGCWCLVLLGLGYAGRFHFTGGAFLRHDWLAAVLVGVCMLERARYRVAGMLLGWAAMSRIFPVLIFAGPLLLAVRRLRSGERPSWYRPLFFGATAAVLLGLLAGTGAGRGVEAWPEFARAIRLHSSEWLTNNVGLEIPLLYDGDVVTRRLVDWNAPEPWIHVQDRIRANRADRLPWIVAAKLAFLAIWALSIWRAPLPEAALAGMAVVFALTSPTSYYWIWLVALPLLRRADLVLGALALNAVAFAMHLLHPAFEMRFAIFSVGLALLLLGWLLPNALTTSRELLRFAAPVGDDAAATLCLDDEEATRS